MTEASVRAAASLPRLPLALFMGDFNVGKSSLINALLRRETLLSTREESRALPTFVARSAQREARYVALLRDGAGLEAKSHEEFLEIRREIGRPSPYGALGAALPGGPFSRLILVDTAGMSSDLSESVRLSRLPGQESMFFVAVADIEYWSAKHTLDFIAYHHELFNGSMVIVANKADHLNAEELKRIRDKAPIRLERYGIAPQPRFFPVSARLESARGLPHNEYRRRVKPEVRDLCDAAFDALRVALYEFEAMQGGEPACQSFKHLLQTPMATAFVQAQEGSTP